MRVDDISGLPYSAIGDALRTTSHARYMMGALLSMCPDMQGANSLARSCMSSEFARSAARCQQDGIVQELISEGLLPWQRIYEYAEKAFGQSIGSDIPSEKAQTSLLALGSPLIKQKLPELCKNVKRKQHESKGGFFGEPAGSRRG